MQYLSHIDIACCSEINKGTTFGDAIYIYNMSILNAQYINIDICGFNIHIY